MVLQCFVWKADKIIIEMSGTSISHKKQNKNDHNPLKIIDFALTHISHKPQPEYAQD